LAGSHRQELEARVLVDIAVTNESTQLSDADIAFWVEASNQHLQECCAAHGVPFTPVSLYRSTDTLPAFEIRKATFVDAIPEAPWASAYHTVGDDGSIYSKMRADSGPVGLMHENDEEAIDPECVKQATDPQGRVWDYEICDPVQGDTRKRSVTVLGETREVDETNYVLPSFFVAGSAGPWDAFGLCTGPWQVRPGGYAVIDGNEVFAEGDAVAAAAVAAKKADVGSRLNRRAAARVAALADIP
jgi:hypothetical protein